ncbi:hypothetical protein ACFY93_05495 [Streptomyces sp. NPDC008313]|uniref:hypothetical protein n=1 Tax=Streptomyces sp. NPDC008313 TaxID=3364826 RepID=UPI0036E93916
MAESVPVRCPFCRREHLYAPPSYPCVCGAPVTPALDRLAAPEPVTQRTWDEDWAEMRCGACGRASHWPHPEWGCACGTVLRFALRRTPGPAEQAEGTEAASSEEAEGTEAASAETPVARRPFQPVTIRTARDAVTAAALYLRWLGYRDIRRADQRPPAGVGLAARGILAQVDPTVRPATVRDVECLWLTAMTESAQCVYFSLAGYADDARSRADALGVPLFVLDLTGTPQPVNSPAGRLCAPGA